MSDLSKKSLNQHKGRIGEILARMYLENHGFEVKNYMFMVDMSDRLDSRIGGPYKLARDFIGLKKEDFKQLIKVIQLLYDDSEHRRRCFDFMAKKDGNYYVVEVKTNTSPLLKSQITNLELAKQLGFIPIVVTTKVDVKANLNDISIQIL